MRPVGNAGLFGNLILCLLVRMGYGGCSVTDVAEAFVHGPGDGGVDSVIDQDPLGMNRIYV